MAKSVEDIDRQIEILKEQRKRQVAAEAEKKREGLRSCKEALGGEVVGLFENWTNVDPQLFSLFVAEHGDEIISSCSTTENDLNVAVKRTKDFIKEHSKTRRRSKKDKVPVPSANENDEAENQSPTQEDPQHGYPFTSETTY